MSNRHQAIEQLETINNLPYEVTNATQRSSEWFKDRYGKIKIKKLLYIK